MSEEFGRPRRGLRRLTDEEIELWTAVARSVARRRGATLPALSRPKQPSDLQPALAPAATPSPPPTKKPRLLGQPLAPLERRLKRDLRRGRAAIDDALDLHGYNQAEAHHALRGFLISAQARGLKLVVVVTGKGSGPRNSTSWLDEPGVLRRLAPYWLREADMRSVVLGFEEAGPAHGGAGALYVRLRRRAPVR